MLVAKPIFEFPGRSGGSGRDFERRRRDQRRRRKTTDSRPIPGLQRPFPGEMSGDQTWQAGHAQLPYVVDILWRLAKYSRFRPKLAWETFRFNHRLSVSDQLPWQRLPNIGRFLAYSAWLRPNGFVQMFITVEFVQIRQTHMWPGPAPNLAISVKFGRTPATC